MRQIAKIIALMAAILLPQIALAGCVGDDTPCTIGQGVQAGEYHLILPEGNAPESGWPAVVFLHGWGADGAAMMQKSKMISDFTDHSFAVIAPDGTAREGRNGRQWLFHPNHRNGRDESAFLSAVADDAARRFNLDRETMILAGYSIGGSMVSYVACGNPESFAAFAPGALDCRMVGDDMHPAG